MAIDGLSIKSVISSRELLIHSLRPFEFTVDLRGSGTTATTDVYAPPGSDELVVFLEALAALDAPWKAERQWSSLEGEFRLSARCTALGRVTFAVQLQRQFGGDEQWSVSADIAYHLGALPSLALDARRFFDRLSASQRL